MPDVRPELSSLPKLDPLDLQIMRVASNASLRALSGDGDTRALATVLHALSDAEPVLWHELAARCERERKRRGQAESTDSREKISDALRIWVNRAKELSSDDLNRETRAVAEEFLRLEYVQGLLENSDGIPTADRIARALKKAVDRDHADGPAAFRAALRAVGMSNRDADHALDFIRKRTART